MASAAVHDAVGESFTWRRLDGVAVIGRREGIDIYELLGKGTPRDPARLEARNVYEQALE